MFECEKCGDVFCCERTDIIFEPVLCDKCYEIAKQDQEDREAIEEIFSEN